MPDGGVESWLKLVGGEYNNILFYLPHIFIKLKSKEPGEKTGQAPLLYFPSQFLGGSDASTLPSPGSQVIRNGCPFMGN
jgi:hypothetical protein